MPRLAASARRPGTIRHMGKTFAINDLRRGPAPPGPRAPASGLAAGQDRIDTLGRPLRDLRISVTDRCNFRCSYCMPKEVFDNQHVFLPHSALLSFEEITRLARLFAGAGTRKLRLTGGEPLLRKDLEHLVAMLAALRTPDGMPLDLTLTTNGSLLARKAAALKSAGLSRLTVSLDAIDDAAFRRMNDVGFAVADVLAGIDAAIAAGFAPVKVNMVVKKGSNDDQVVPLARALHARYGNAAVLRFIEFMDVGSTNGWRLDDVLASRDVLARLREIGPLGALPASSAGETAQRWRFEATGQEIGLVSSVTQAFCGSCNRARLSTDGQLYLCLFATHGHDLRALLRGGADDAAIAAAIDHVWGGRDDRYSALRGAATPPAGASDERRVEMHYIGG
jgi:GTP 3',8-cyclase